MNKNKEQVHVNIMTEIQIMDAAVYTVNILKNKCLQKCADYTLNIS